jgi:GNAT superfamily N-acetyltransferase
MQVRLAKSTEAALIAEFNIAMAFETESKILNNDLALNGVKNLFAQPQFGFYVVAEHQSKIVASLMITFEWSDWRNEVIWWIQSVYVKPENRGQNIFGEMLHFIEKKATENGINTLRLYMDNENKKAHQVYLKNNFTETNYLLFEKKLDPNFA